MLQDDLLTHLQFVHGENVQCPKCEFKGYPSFELGYHQMIEHGVCDKCTDGKDENHHLKVQHQSRIQELTTVQSQRRKPGPNSRQIAMNTLNSAGESNSDESMDQMEIMEKIIESDEDETLAVNQVLSGENETSIAVNLAKPGLMSAHQPFTRDPKFIKPGPLSKKKSQSLGAKLVTDLQNDGENRRGKKRSLSPSYGTGDEIEENGIKDYTPQAKIGRPSKSMKSPAIALSTVQPAAIQSKTLPQVSPTTQPKLPPKPILKALPPKMTTKIKAKSAKDLPGAVNVMPAGLASVLAKRASKMENAGAKENLDCKYCNTFFTYKAPNKKALIHHLKSLHEKELAKESPAYRKEIFGNDFFEEQSQEAKPGAPLTPNPTETSVQKKTWVDTPRPTSSTKSKIKQILMSGAIDNTEIGKFKQELNTSIEEYNPEKNSGLASNSPKSSVDQNSVPTGFKNSFVPTNVAATEIQQPNLNAILEETKPAGDVISGDLDKNNSVQDESEVDMSCKLCNKWFTYTAPDKESLKEHYATIHKDEKIPGPESKKSTFVGIPFDLESMIQMVYKCVHCPKGKMFTHQSANALQHHLKANHRNIFVQDELLKKEELPKTFKCLPCGKFFTPRKEELVEHIKNQHQNLN